MTGLAWLRRCVILVSYVSFRLSEAFAWFCSRKFFGAVLNILRAEQDQSIADILPSVLLAMRQKTICLAFRLLREKKEKIPCRTNWIEVNYSILQNKGKFIEPNWSLQTLQTFFRPVSSFCLDYKEGACSFDFLSGLKSKAFIQGARTLINFRLESNQNKMDSNAHRIT